jgi:hypothetical protein
VRFMVDTKSAMMLSLLDFEVNGVVLRSEESGEIVRFGSLRAGRDKERQKWDLGTAGFRQ